MDKIALLKQLTALNGTSGYEDEVIDFITTLLTEHDIPYQKDPLGNMIVQTGKTPNRITLFAHMDEVGFGVRGIRPDGMIKFAAIGGVTDGILFSTPVVIGKNKIPGVIGNIPKHLQEKSSDKETKIPDMMIDIGATSKEDAQSLVKIGDPIYWQSDFVQFGDGLIKAKALDDRVGVAVILGLLLTKKYSFTAVFTTREEIGIMGAKMTIPVIAPEKAVVLEVTTCADMPGATEPTTKMGEGVALSVLDGASVSDSAWNSFIWEIATAKNVPIQKKLTTKGGNDAGAVSYVSGGVPTATLSLPGRYIHSPANVISEADYDSMYRLAELLIKKG
ncbi:MAG: M42 family metallopeptidase [Ruminococcaceae bacterium]|nr:M42 family metallopeptidase [Oscillospiraceae bacterium]